jgi:hypothetical protein
MCKRCSRRSSLLNVTLERGSLLNVTLLNVTLLNVFLLNVTLLNVTLLNVTLLNATLLYVLSLCEPLPTHNWNETRMRCTLAHFSDASFRVVRRPIANPHVLQEATLRTDPCQPHSNQYHAGRLTRSGDTHTHIYSSYTHIYSCTRQRN